MRITHLRSRLVLGSAIAAVLVLGWFGLAGRGGLARLGPYAAVSATICLIAALVIDPALARERRRRGQETIDPGRLSLIRALILTHIVVAALDVGRFHWSDSVPRPLSLAALAVFALSLLWVLWAMSVNPFFVPAIRVQSERGHQVVDRAAYAIVRHPGYGGLALALPSSALALGSWWGLVPALASSALFVWRTADEDRFLLQRLDGYAAYSARVRFRLLPGVW